VEVGLNDLEFIQNGTCAITEVWVTQAT
jgi:hypothetical protein